MIGKLLLNKKINIIDGDDRLNACPSVLKPNLIKMLEDGMYLKGIQIFHYAAVHYNTRWRNYPARFLNALFNSLSSIEDNGKLLCLNNLEDHELQGDSSEVLGIGLSNMFMCRWYGVNINKIEKIQGTAKRCDFRFGYKTDVIVFEARGRANSSHIKSALKDCILKKKNYTGDIKYSTICHLPRNYSPITLHLYDPPIDGDRLNYNEIYVMVKHYKRVVEMAGLTMLASSIDKRIKDYERNGIWEYSPLQNSNVIKMGYSVLIKVNNYEFLSRSSQDYIERKENKVFLRFGIEKTVIELLEKWDLPGLANITYEEIVSEEGISVLPDGSLFYVGSKNF